MTTKTLSRPAAVDGAFHVKNVALADQGRDKIEWAAREMPVLLKIRERFQKERPLKDVAITACLHVTAETANLMLTLKAGGAKLALCASNPLSTQDDVAAALAKHFGVATFAIKGEDRKTYYSHIQSALAVNPQITMDDGADVVSTIHENWSPAYSRILGGTEETTTGVVRLRAMERDQALRYPIIAVNDAQTKHFFDNRYGTGQSTIDGILRCTNLLLAGRNVVVAGYGWCGRGVAQRARGMGALVIVTEVDPTRALEAAMDGYQVLPMREAAKLGDLFITVTGDIHVLDADHFKAMRDGAILANSGHFNVEINLEALEAMSKKVRTVRENVQEFSLKTGKRVFVLGEGRLINLAAAEGHPASVMDMSFANQALCSEHLVKQGHDLAKRVHSVPVEIDREIAAIKLSSMGIELDKLTPRQERYLTSWNEGT